MKTTLSTRKSRLLPKFLTIFLTAAVCLSSWPPFMHANDIVRISPELRDVMGLETVKVGASVIPKTLSFVGRVEPIAQKHYFVSSRVAGRVIALSVVEGQNVDTDAILVEIETLQPGNPPPKQTLRAPFSGVVTKVSVTRGQGVEVGQTLIELANLDAVYARAEVFESLVDQIPDAAKARIQVEAFPEESFPGTLERLGGEVNPANGSLPAWFRVANPKHLLRPGMLTSFQVITAETNASITVPATALLGNAAAPFVYVGRDKEGLEYRRVLLKTGVRGENRVEILEGLAPGNRVVYVNAHLLGLSAGGGAPNNSHGHDHGGHGHGGHGHEGHGSDQGEGFQWDAYLFWWLVGGLGLSVFLNLFLLRGRWGGPVEPETSS